MSAAAGEAVDTGTRLLDAAWWAMDVPCFYPDCGQPSVWLWCMPCGCRQTACHPHKKHHARHIARKQAQGHRVAYCGRCGKQGMALDDHYWRPL